MLILPDAKDSVNEESPKEAEDDIGPRVPGIQLHELGRVQVQILHKTHVDCFIYAFSKLNTSHL